MKFDYSPLVERVNAARERLVARLSAEQIASIGRGRPARHLVEVAEGVEPELSELRRAVHELWIAMLANKEHEQLAQKWYVATRARRHRAYYGIEDAAQDAALFLHEHLFAKLSPPGTHPEHAIYRSIFHDLTVAAVNAGLPVTVPRSVALNGGVKREGLEALHQEE